MSPAERHALFEASIVTDLENAPRELVERARARVERRAPPAAASRDSRPPHPPRRPPRPG